MYTVFFICPIRLEKVTLWNMTWIIVENTKRQNTKCSLIPSVGPHFPLPCSYFYFVLLNRDDTVKWHVCIKTTPLFSFHFTAAVEQTSIVSSDESKSLYDTVCEHNFMRLVFHTETRNEQDWFYYTVGTSRRMPQQGFPSVHWPTIMSALLLHIKFLFIAHTHPHPTPVQ